VRRAVLFGAFLAACSSGLPHPHYLPQSTGSLQPVDRAPPPARVEIVPARPSPEAVWIDGEWTWRRGLWAWLPGRWTLAPEGASFSAWVFVRRADGTLWYAPGVWRDEKGAPVTPPAPLALANVEAGAVVGADGILRERPRPAPSPSSSSQPAETPDVAGAAGVTGETGETAPAPGVER
jgi:hypothetical protein